MTKCKLCLRLTKQGELLCKKHKVFYIFDKEINGFRLRKTKNGTATRYTRKKFHSHEIELTKILERYYGTHNIVTSFHPLWAVSNKRALLEYDIFIKNKNILIEYNGEQHYKFIRIFHRRLKRFEDQKTRDALKETLAKANNFKFIVIKYNEPLVEDYIITKIGATNVQ